MGLRLILPSVLVWFALASLAPTGLSAQLDQEPVDPLDTIPATNWAGYRNHITPTGLAHPCGTVYRNTNLFVQTLSYGLSNHWALGGSVELASPVLDGKGPGWAGFLRYSGRLANKVYFSLTGVLARSGANWSPPIYAYSGGQMAFSYGTPDKLLTLNIGLQADLLDNYDPEEHDPLLSPGLSCQWRLGKSSTWLLIDAFGLIDLHRETYQEPGEADTEQESGTFGALLAGIRMVKRGVHTDLSVGLAGPTDFLDAVPLIQLSVGGQLGYRRNVMRQGISRP